MKSMKFLSEIQKLHSQTELSLANKTRPSTSYPARSKSRSIASRNKLMKRPMSTNRKKLAAKNAQKSDLYSHLSMPILPK
jgi:hypothetical protein